MAGSSGISTTSLAKGSGGGLSWRGAAPGAKPDVVLQEKALQRIAVPKVPLIKVLLFATRLAYHPAVPGVPSQRSTASGGAVLLVMLHRAHPQGSGC